MTNVMLTKDMEITNYRTIEREGEYEDVINRPSTKHREFTLSIGETIRFFKMNVNPKNAGESADPLSFCRNKKIIGIGWGYDIDFDSPEEYLAYLTEEKGFGPRGMRPIKDFIIWMDSGDIVLVYDKTESQCYLVRITSEWKYFMNGGIEYEEHDYNDIVQFREAEWQPVDRNLLPGSITCRGTIQKWKQLDKANAWGILQAFENPERQVSAELPEDIANQEPRDIIKSLSYDELESVVVYLLMSEENLVPRRDIPDDFPDVETILMGDEGGTRQRVGVQVKRGTLDPNEIHGVIDEFDELYVYARNDVDIGTNITDRDIVDFILNNPGKVPESTIRRLSVFYN